ncbi:MAG: glycosyltransferase family 2 protein, partial [Chitinophagales bacterium]|nr:glycosyltransferase family 2 protein [Chitinophagales bacterium]
MEHPIAAVVILNYNGRKYLERFLPSVVKYTVDYWTKIYVADNASTDDSVSFLQENFPEITIIKFDKNYGYAEGYNQALRQIKADYYVLLNSDVEVTKDWLQPLINIVKSDEKIAAAQPKILDFNRRDYFEYAGAAGGHMDILGYPFCLGRVFDHIEKDDGQYNEQQPVFWASGACFIVDATVFHRLGGFDGDFFAHQEEIDFCWRILRSGYEVWSCPQSRVYHIGGG